MKLSFALFLLLTLGDQCFTFPYGGTKGSPPSYGPPEVLNEALTEEIGISDGSSGPYGESESSKAAKVAGPFDYEFMNTDESSAGNRGKEPLILGVQPEESGVEIPYVPDQTDQTSVKEVAVKVPQEEKSSSWFNELAKKWDFIKDKTEEGARSLGEKVQSVYEDIQSEIPQLWKDFKAILANFGRMVHRGAEFVVQKISGKYEEARATELIKRLQDRLEQGEDTVAQFFESVGRKATEWMQEHDRANIDDGLFQENKEFSQHFADPTFPDLFQDKEVQSKLERMVGAGVISQGEMDLLCQHQTQPIHQNPETTSNQNENIIPDFVESLGGPLENILIGGTEPLDQQKEPVYGNDSPVYGKPEIETPKADTDVIVDIILDDLDGTNYGNEGTSIDQLKEDVPTGPQTEKSQKEPAYGNDSPVYGKPEIETPKTDTDVIVDIILDDLDGTNYGNEGTSIDKLKEDVPTGPQTEKSQKEPAYGNDSPVYGKPEIETPKTDSDVIVDTILDDLVGTNYGNEGTSVDQLKEDVPLVAQAEKPDFGTKPQTDIIVDKYSDNSRGNDSPLVEEPTFSETYNDVSSGNADSTGIYAPNLEHSNVDLDVLPTQNVEPHHTTKKELQGPGALDQQKQSKSDVLFEPDYQDYLTVPKESNNNEGAAILFPDHW